MPAAVLQFRRSARELKLAVAGPVARTPSPRYVFEIYDFLRGGWVNAVIDTRPYTAVYARAACLLSDAPDAIPARAFILIYHPLGRLGALFRHGRSLPFRPTGQSHLERRVGTVTQKTKWEKIKGNPAAGIDLWVWDSEFNNVRCWEKLKGDRKLADKLTKNGVVRDLVIDKLIERGLLAVDFQDINA
ncbi:uncharacterized protein RAG0_15165 [Rhynchosporium agropyri]|uniref:Uncharacterized protein n=1 Tax=Rhynchosporium agropyri TaxID=914238 RepID=A0A1E1LJY2_9HELO|nr:uncharacterized protein RAG0_15165 [Rhynchosporium agropyri]